MDIPQTDLGSGQRTVLFPHYTQDNVTVDMDHHQEEERQPFLLQIHQTRITSQSRDYAGHSITGLNSCVIDENLHRNGNFSVTVNVNETPSSDVEKERAQGAEVSFHVGQDRQLMVGKDYELASISPVFKAMFNETWKRGENVPVEIQDVGTQAFAVILRCAAKDRYLHLTESIVWDVLKAADKYQVLPVVQQCFHFLLHKHQCRRRSSHICMVLETAHSLNYVQHYAECMQIAKRRGKQIFKSEGGLRELCHDCMLELVRADDLRVSSEMLVHDAVITWARCACAKKGAKEPGKEELRNMAGKIARHVRYLTMPPTSLENLRAGLPSGSCLLTSDEIQQLLEGDAHSFPSQVNQTRDKSDAACTHLLQCFRCCMTSAARNPMLSVFFLAGLLLLFLFAILYVPIVFFIKDSDDMTEDPDLVNGLGN